MLNHNLVTRLYNLDQSIRHNNVMWVAKLLDAVAKSNQSCPTLWDPIDSSPPGSPVPGILQARTLEWVAISFSNEGKWKVKVKSLSRVWLLVSMVFSRQEYWSGVPLPSTNYQHVIIECRVEERCKIRTQYFIISLPHEYNNLNLRSIDHIKM